MKYPISEIFDSIQGEGFWTGVRMVFIRLAGCTVGKSYAKRLNPDYNPLPIYIEECTTWDGRKFACDTDFRAKERLDVEEILKRIPEGVSHVCITGGEPLMHRIGDLVQALIDRGILPHIETSGTIDPMDVLTRPQYHNVWITVSPKENALDSVMRAAGELKFLVDAGFKPEDMPPAAKSHSKVYISPINFEHGLDFDNIRYCMELQKKFPNWRLNTQLHKVLGVR